VTKTGERNGKISGKSCPSRGGFRGIPGQQKNERGRREGAFLVKDKAGDRRWKKFRTMGGLG